MFLIGFGFFATLLCHAPWYYWLIGFITLLMPRWTLMLYGIFLSVSLGVSPLVWVIGALCICADAVITILAAN